MIISVQKEEGFSYIQNILIQKIRKLYLYIVYFRFLSRINVHLFNVSVLNWTNSQLFIAKSLILNSVCSLDISDR